MLLRAHPVMREIRKVSSGNEVYVMLDVPHWWQFMRQVLWGHGGKYLEKTMNIIGDDG